MISNILSSKNAIVIGGTNGIGKGIAYSLVKNGANVIICGRSKECSDKIINDFKEMNPNGNYQAILGDITLMSEVDRISNEIKNEGNNIDYLILTQGNPQLTRQLTSEGIDKKLALHYYGRMQFIHNLLPSFTSSLSNSTSPSIVLSILSGGVHSAYTDKNNIGLDKSYNPSNSANAPGFYNDLMLDYFSKYNKKSYFFHLAPGIVHSNYGQTFPFPLNWIVKSASALLGRDLYEVGDEIVQNFIINPKYQKLPNENQQNFYIGNINQKFSPKLKEHTDEYQQLIYNHTKDILKWDN